MRREAVARRASVAQRSRVGRLRPTSARRGEANGESPTLAAKNAAQQ